MRFFARLEMGRWALDMQRLKQATGKTMEELLRAQSRLLVRDCIVLTPPCEKQVPLRRYNLPAVLKAQKSIGDKAVIRDVMRIFVPHESRRVFSIRGNKRGDKLANQLAKIAVTGDVEKLNKTLKAARYTSSGGTFAKITKHAEMQDHADRYAGNGKVRWRNNRVLLHDGNAQPFNPTYGEPEGWKTNASVRQIVETLTERIGTAKSGWVKAAMALKLGLPKWIKSKGKKGSGGIFKVEGVGTEKIAITVGSTVPYMQSKGASMRIIERAWAERKQNIRLQASISKYGKKHGLFKTTDFSKFMPKGPLPQEMTES